MSSPATTRHIAVMAETVAAESLTENLTRIDPACARGFTVTAAADVPEDADVWGLVAGPEVTITPRVLDRLPRLALLAATSAGMDHLPTREALRRGVTVTRVVDYCTDEVADHTLALLLGLVRQTHRLDRALRDGRWGVAAPVPRRVDRTVLGVWGSGLIGTAVASRAAALGMEVLAHGRRPLAPVVGSRVRDVSFDDMVAQCTALTVHVPLIPETRGRIDGDVLRRMPPGGFVINVSRGGIVDEEALADALVTGRLGGAALDVFDGEPIAPDHPLLAAPNLVVTPHAAWYSAEAAAAPAAQIAKSIVDLSSGRLPAGALRGDASL